MTSGRSNFLAIGAVVLALVVQTTVFGRLRVFGVAPDIVMLTVIVASLRMRSEGALLLGFLSGLAFDALSSTAIGLRAFVLTAVALMAVRTRHRADIGPLVAAGWAALITLAGVALFVILGSLFGQFDFAFGEGVRRVAIVPILNLIIALMLSPIVVRLQHSVRKFA
ncbi:MAG: rod shape-determining protein MreD [Acidimicrobiia bacterium]|nr:rod shape-determining protein MreD [Acidimicrobiia bacterium]